MAEQITFPADNSTFTIGNTTYVWDDPPGIWRAYTVGDFSGGGGGGAAVLVPDFVNPTSASSGTDGVLASAAADGNGIFGYYRIYTTHSAGDGAISNVASGSTTIGTGTGWLTQIGGGAASDNVLATDASVTVDDAGPTVVSGSFYIPAGEDLYFAPNSDFRANASVTYYDLMEAGGGSTTVNIGGGSGGLALGTFANQVEGAGTSGTLSLDFSGPAWVWLSGGGGGGGARVDTVLDEYAQNGGAAGSGGFFLEDVSVLEGATYTVGAFGAGASVTKATNDNAAGTAGGTSTLSWSGITLTCIGGAGGSGSSGDAAGNPGGAAGTASISGTDAPTLIPQADLLAAAQDAWRNTVIDGGSGNITLAYAQVSFPTGTSGRGQTLMLDGSGTTSRTATGTNGGAGTLTIVYQPQ